MKLTKDLTGNFTPKDQSNTYYKKPRTFKFVILHWWDDPSKNPTLSGVMGWFKNPASKVSAHYVVSGEKVIQMVEEDNIAWHCGNMNPESIGIEIDPKFPDKTYETVAELIRDICTRRNLPINSDTIKGHREFANTTCPGTLDIMKVIKLANNMTDFLQTDIPTEIEEHFGFKSIKRYNKHWTYEEILWDWVNLTDEVKKQASKLNALESLYDKDTNRLKEDKKLLELKVASLNATTDNQLKKIVELADFEEKYEKLLDTYDQLSGEHRQLLKDYANLDKEINENYITTIRDLEKRILELQRPTPKLSEAIKMCIEAFKKEVLGL